MRDNIIRMCPVEIYEVDEIEAIIYTSSYTPTMQAQNRFALFHGWKDSLDVIVLNVVFTADKILWNDPCNEVLSKRSG